MSNQAVRHQNWLISSSDACVLLILFGNGGIKEWEGICCQGLTLERPEMHALTLKWFQECIKPLRYTVTPPKCNYSRGIRSLLHTGLNTNWRQCVRVYVFCACGSGRRCCWQLVPPWGLCFGAVSSCRPGILSGFEQSGIHVFKDGQSLLLGKGLPYSVLSADIQGVSDVYKIWLQTLLWVQQSAQMLRYSSTQSRTKHPDVFFFILWLPLVEEMLEWMWKTFYFKRSAFDST